MKNQKFLVSLIESITKKQVFIFVWLLVGGFFTFLILNYYKKSNQRNFKEEPFPRKPKLGGGKDWVPAKLPDKNRKEVSKVPPKGEDFKG